MSFTQFDEAHRSLTKLTGLTEAHLSTEAHKDPKSTGDRAMISRTARKREDGLDLKKPANRALMLEFARFTRFAENLRRIAEYNSAEHGSVRVRANQFATMSAPSSSA